MVNLDELVEIVSAAVPNEWVTQANSPEGEGAAQQLLSFEWNQGDEKIGGLTIELYENEGVMSFLGLEVSADGQSVFRNLCGALPDWANRNGISVFVVPFARSEQMRTLLEAAGFNQIGDSWLANISESNAVEAYGNS